MHVKVGAHTTLKEMVGMIEDGVDRAEGIVCLTSEQGIRYTIEVLWRLAVATGGARRRRRSRMSIDYSIQQIGDDHYKAESYGEDSENSHYSLEEWLRLDYDWRSTHINAIEMSIDEVADEMRSYGDGPEHYLVEKARTGIRLARRAVKRGTRGYADARFISSGMAAVMKEIEQVLGKELPDFSGAAAQSVAKKYEDTPLGRQEFGGEMLD